MANDVECIFSANCLPSVTFWKSENKVLMELLSWDIEKATINSIQNGSSYKFGYSGPIGS